MSGQRSTRRLGRLALPVVGGLLVAACGGGVSAGALTGKSATQVLAAGIGAAKARATVHYVLEASGGGHQQQTITGDAGRDRGMQTVVTGSDQVAVELVGGTCYLRGNAGGLEHTVGLTAASAGKYADQWISVQPSDPLYQPITQAVTIGGVFQQLTPTGTLATSTPGKVDGRDVVGVRGGLPGTAQKGVKGVAVLYVSTAPSKLPVGFTGQASSGKQNVTEIGAFSRWNESLSLAAPSGAVAFSSIPAS